MEKNQYGRLVSVLVSPAKTFRSIADHPTWLVAILALVLSSVLMQAIWVTKIDWEDHWLVQRGDLTLQEVKGLESNALSRPVLVGVLLWIVLPLVAAIFLVLFRQMGSELQFKTSLSVFVHGLMPVVIGTLLSIFVLLGAAKVTSEDVVPLNLGFLAGENASLVTAVFLGSMDLFSLWAIILLVIGYSITAKVSKWRAAACVVGLWLLSVAAMTGFVALYRVAG